MSKANSKRIMAIVAVIALVAILGVCLVACNKDDYVKRLENAGYKVESGTAKDAGLSEDVEVEWVVIAGKGGFSLSNGIEAEQVTVVKFKNTNDAKDCESKVKEHLPNGWKVERSSAILIVGTEQGVKDAK